MITSFRIIYVPGCALLTPTRLWRAPINVRLSLWFMITVYCFIIYPLCVPQLISAQWITLKNNKTIRSPPWVLLMTEYTCLKSFVCIHVYRNSETVIRDTVNQPRTSDQMVRMCVCSSRVIRTVILKIALEGFLWAYKVECNYIEAQTEHCLCRRHRSVLQFIISIYTQGALLSSIYFTVFNVHTIAAA